MATSEELEALKLTGDKWTDQQLQPLDPLVPSVTVPYPAPATWPYKLLPDQVDNIRDAINALLSGAQSAESDEGKPDFVATFNQKLNN